MSEQWLRLARVTVSRPAAGPVSPTGTSPESLHAIANSRVSFQIEKNMVPPQPHRAEINVYNLALSTHNSINVHDFGESKVHVILEVGYLGADPGAEPTDDSYGVIFNGNVRTIDRVRQGTDWITKIQCSDWERAFRQKTKHSFAKGTPAEDVIRVIITDTGLGRGNIEEMIEGLTGKPDFASGLAVRGNATDILTQLLSKRGWDWTIENGELRFIPQGSMLRKTAVVLKPTSGLVGSPEHAAPEKVPYRSTLRIRSLLDHRIQFGVPIELTTSEINGAQYYPTEIVHKGDTHGADWYTIVGIRPPLF